MLNGMMVVIKNYCGNLEELFLIKVGDDDCVGKFLGTWRYLS